MAILQVEFLSTEISVLFNDGSERSKWLQNEITRYAHNDRSLKICIGFDFGHQENKENPDFSWCIWDGEKRGINGGLIWHGDHYGSHT